MRQAKGLTRHHKEEVLSAEDPKRDKEKSAKACRANLKLGTGKSAGSTAALVHRKKKTPHCLQTLLTVSRALVSRNMGHLWKVKDSGQAALTQRKECSRKDSPRGWGNGTLYLLCLSI